MSVPDLTQHDTSLDMDKLEVRKCAVVYTQRIFFVRIIWHKILQNSKNGELVLDKDVPEKLLSPNFYYKFTFETYHFLVLTKKVKY